jgi:hypothetical protein
LVGRDHDLQPASLEVFHGALALGLALPLVQRGHGIAAALELAGQPVRALTLAREHDSAARLARTCEQAVEQLDLQEARNRIDRVRDARRRLRRHEVHANGLDECFLGEAVELGGHRGREQQRLARLGQELQELADLAGLTHVHHAVGFVEHQDLEVLERERLARMQLEQPVRRWRSASTPDREHAP